jgi:hypothetical protein
MAGNRGRRIGATGARVEAAALIQLQVGDRLATKGAIGALIVPDSSLTTVHSRATSRAS